MGTPAMGHQAQLAFDDSTFDTSSEPYEFIRETLSKVQSHVSPNGIRGTRSAISENVSLGPYAVSGQIVMHPTPTQLALILPRILGTAPSGTTFALAETVPSFNIMIDRKSKVFTYAGCKIDKATFRSSHGNPLELTLDIEGLTETVGNAGTFPALTLSSLQPYMHHASSAGATIVAAAREVNNVEITIDNALVKDRWNNSITRTALPESDRIITFNCDCPYSSDEVALYDAAIAGAAGSIVYTNGAYSITFTFGNLQAPPKTPNVQARNQEIPLRLEMVARMLSTTRELVITNDSTG